MSSFKIPFSGRAHSYTRDELDTVNEVMQNANTLTQGTRQLAFQKNLLVI